MIENTKHFTAGYSYFQPNFVIQNLDRRVTDNDYYSLLCVMKNILQRGFPTTMSEFLQNELGQKRKHTLHRTPLVACESDAPRWAATIKGDAENNYYPAREFFEHIIPNELGEFAFIQGLTIPEFDISEIVNEGETKFIRQQVDFYCPAAKLILEIDGQQHKNDPKIRHQDWERDTFLANKGITTIRISTVELQTGGYHSKIEAIRKHLSRYSDNLNPYKIQWEKGDYSEDERQEVLMPAAIMRLQILLLELLSNQTLALGEPWNINLFTREGFGDFVILAIKDLQTWLGQLWLLYHKTEMRCPRYELRIVTDQTDFSPHPDFVNIDFSIIKRYTDEHRFSPDVIYVRNDYFDSTDQRNYFRVSTSIPLKYSVGKGEEAVLKFFLKNIFDKDEFRDGQFQIITNILSRQDTIGLLPTGGGKSICYQLPCLLQPSVSFVVCPIKSLMIDQHRNIEKLGITNVNFISSDLTTEEREKAIQDFGCGRYLLVWISPERFQIPRFRAQIKTLQNEFSIAYAVIDEVHCMSEWGHDFRTSYLNLIKTIDQLSPQNADGSSQTKFIGLTATASLNVLKDIRAEFSRNSTVFDENNIKSLLDYSRKELVFDVVESKYVNPQNGRIASRKDIHLIEKLDDAEIESGLISQGTCAALVFTPHVNGPYGCKSVSDDINLRFKGKSNWYSGQVPHTTQNDGKGGKIKSPVMNEHEFRKHKEEVQKAFTQNKLPIMVATKAFGMGIDKDNIEYTFHYGLPASVEALYQEAGRAGRWDKKKEPTRRAFCRVLYGKETIEESAIQNLFHLDTTFQMLAEAYKEYEKIGQDLFRQLFLFSNGQQDIEEDLNLVLGFLGVYFEAGEKRTIHWKDAQSKLGVGEDRLQKTIYRLSIIGVVADWTTDFVNHYEVTFNDLNPPRCVKFLENYIHKYAPLENVQAEIKRTSGSSPIERLARYLLTWIFKNITYQRKQSLKTIRDFCEDFQDSDSFKQRLDNYFRITESTFVLQHIAENPNEYTYWFDALLIRERNPQNNEVEIKGSIHSIQNADDRRKRFEALRDGISRFLESYPRNPGLNFLSGITRLFLGQYQDTDGINRFEDMLIQIRDTDLAKYQSQITDRLLEIAVSLDESGKKEIYQSMVKFFPQLAEDIARRFDMPSLLKEHYQKRLFKLQQLNTKLNEHLQRI